jgi:hypothetical protein
MRVTTVAAAVLALASVANAQQATVQYVISAHVFAANPPDSSGPVQVVAAPTLIVEGGRVAILQLGDQTNPNNLRFAVTPSDLGAGKVGLKVVVEARRGGRVASSTFDVLTGVDTAAATVALRDAAGAFMLDDQGRPLFASFETTTRRQ